MSAGPVTGEVTGREPRRATPGGDPLTAEARSRSGGPGARLRSAGPPARAGLARLGFLGLGWIGLHRLRSVVESGAGDIVAVADPSDEAVAAALRTAPSARRAASLEELLGAGLDGVVIATPNALHAEQAVAALERGVAVFCQKPLARTGRETRRVLDAARAADRFVAADLSYRFTAAVGAVRQAVRSGGLGEIFAVELVFHNAYGPDKAWFYDTRLAGGGCVMDLGVHLVDLALWTLGFPAVTEVSSRLFAGGTPLAPGESRVEDYAVARLDLATGAVAQLACSWRLSAGRDAVIDIAFYGTEAAAAMRNVAGSFYDFTAEQYRGTSTRVLAEPPDAWGGRAICDWARRLAQGERFDPAAERLVEVAAVLDRIYGR